MTAVPSSRPDGSASVDATRQMDDALTELAAYALLIEVERNRVQHRFIELGATESSAADRVELMRAVVGDGRGARGVPRRSRRWPTRSERAGTLSGGT